MNTFKKKSLYAALAGVSALGATGAAQAVSVNPDGLGQALIYPYYTVREKATGQPYASLLSVVNSTSSAKAVKVRFLEGKNSREVLDFNLYLSKKDVWVAAIIPTAAGAGVFTADKSCTSPTVSASAAAPTEFVNFAYTGSQADGADSSLDRTREGYVEIIEMGDISDPDLEDDVTHVGGPAGTPPGCGNVPVTLAQAQGLFSRGSGGLFGGMTIINVQAGVDFAVDATALEGFSDQVIWAEPGSVDPTLSFVSPKTSVVIDRTRTIVTDWALSGTAVDPVSAVLMHDNVYNEYVLETGTRSRTDWVLTMPTKRFYIATGPGNNAGKLFQRNFNGNNGSCDDVSATTYDREEFVVRAPGGFSPPRPQQVDALCWEANIFTYNLGTGVSPVFGSKNAQGPANTLPNGWTALNFPVIGTAGAVTAKHILYGGASTVFDTLTVTPGSPVVPATQTSTTFYGLPVVGFAAITFDNGSVGGLQSSYGGNFTNKATRRVQ